MKFIRYLLFPFSIVYHIVTTVRNWLFDSGVFKETSFEIPVITVGNLSVGGTGKTPQIENLIRLLKDNHQIAVLSRGYKRNTKEFIILNEISTAQEVGDEPLQYFQKFKNITVAVDTDRAHGISTLLEKTNTDLILLDDAFQHRKVKASFYLLLTKYDDLFTDDFLIPTGNLRESRIGAKRADLIIVTKCPSNLEKASRKKIEQQLQRYHKPLFFTSISYADSIKGAKPLLTNELKNFEVLLITGIANPTPLLNHLKSLNIRFIHLQYSDHHHFSEKEITQIQQQFSEIQSENKIVLTTEKDYTRLEHRIAQLNYLPIEIQFLGNQKKQFDNLITSHIQNFAAKC